jgi:Ca2+-transporting ATPase
VNHWHRMEVSEVGRQLDVPIEGGLASDAVAVRREKEGWNELIDRGGKNPWGILWEQLTATMVVILIIAAGISAILKDFKDAIAILAIVLLNTILGFTQEFRAEKAMAALKKLATPTVKVKRDGGVHEISSRELVPGDIVLLEAGSLVPADGRVVESASLRIQEASLTGESEPVDKHTHALSGEDLPLGDRRNVAYRGTLVAFGRGQIIVTETGMNTEIGRIADMIQRASQDPTPLQKRLDRLAKQLALIAIVIVGVVFFLGLLRGEDARLMFLTAVSMAVAAVPEGLPAVVTIALALGAQRMFHRHALIRKLPAVETLGSVTVICSDKTGTLTQNRMTVIVLDVAGHRAELPPFDRGSANVQIDVSSTPSLGLLLTGSALCNDAIIDDTGQGTRVIGDPTEGALLTAAGRCGLSLGELNASLPRVAELAFDSVRKRMTTVHRVPKNGTVQAFSSGPGTEGTPYIAFTKGAVDSLLEVSSAVWTGVKAEPLDSSWREKIQAANHRLAATGVRVLGLAIRFLSDVPENQNLSSLENDLVFVGLIGMIDPPRTEAKAAVEVCKSAGIRPVMITGDHPLTALFIATQLGIATDDRILTGQDLNRLSVEELMAQVETVSVYARVSPEHKLKIIDAFQRRGHNVAMTGDGVNDAPALKKADIGVAMGITGTDVSKEAADMVLIDDNFATIVSSVEEGRVIYDNIRKFIKYLLTTNSAEILVMLGAPFLGMPLPLLPLQILWINLVTDGPPALTLSVEPAERDVMKRPPRQPQENILGRGMGWHVLWVGITMTILSLGLGYGTWRLGHETWQTLVFTSLAFCQMAHVLAVRSEKTSLFRQGLFSNPWLLGAVLLTLGLQLLVVFTPLFQKVFKTKPLSLAEVGLCVAAASIVFIAVESEKWVKRSKKT